VFETKTIKKNNGRFGHRANVAPSALMAAFGKAPPPPARAPRAAAKPVYTNDVDGAYNCFRANGGKEDDFWGTVETRLGKTDGLTEAEWKALISWFQQDAPAPAAPPARAAAKPATPRPPVDADDDIPF